NEYYTHRIGRTGRAKREGESYILYTKEERARVRDILRYTRNTATPIAFDEAGDLVKVED
ncbi:MAG: ATP-dependent helicase, partial [Ruthenibacterium sp.]